MISFDKEQIFIVTGASSGIGKCVAETLNALGATVVAIARREDKLIELKENAKFPENIHIEIKDLSENIEELPDYVKSLKAKYGKFSGMAYCAGIGEVQPLQLMDYENTTKEFKINYFAPIFMLKGISDRRINTGKGTSCVFIASIAASCCDKGHVVYSGSKAALISSVKAAAKELSASGVRLNCVSPSIIETPMTNDFEYINSQKEKYPMGIGKPDDVANLLVYLLSDTAKFISGQNYIIDSGGVL